MTKVYNNDKRYDVMIDNYRLFRDLASEEKEIFNLIQKNGVMTKNEILFKTGMKLTTLNRVMNPLEKKSILVQKCMGESTGGRKPVLYDVNVCRFYIMGISICSTHVQVSIVNLRMEIFYKKGFYIDYCNSCDEVIEEILYIIKSAYEELNLKLLQLVGIGLAVETGFWDNERISRILEEKLGCSVTSGNCADSAVTAEYFYGAGRNFENMAYFDCGARLKQAAVIQGRIMRSSGDNEYAFEHMIENIYGYIDFNEVYSRSMKNCGTSEKFILDAASKLGKSIESYTNLLNIECIVLSGFLIDFDTFYETCIKYIPERVSVKRYGYFKEDSVSVGAAALFLERCIDNKNSKYKKIVVDKVF
ncbi:ROK family transcriptional regulator [Clostridium sp. MT-14]|uniref:ROK family transcriptional regulator n=1 Tax=Clostridium aromativorans TaxID=2836848 RepID=A0ABS8N2Y9_9CLOT|nr:ROK family transcriptional regulator [Clostridium aromativorans]